MINSIELSNTMYDILRVMGKDAEFLHNTIYTYINDGKHEDKQHLLEVQLSL
jgi:hypothetical protein